MNYKKKSRNALKGNWGTVLLVVLIGVIINSISSGISFYDNGVSSGITFNQNLLISIALLPLAVGKTKIYCDITNNKTPDIVDILKGFKDGFYLKNLSTLLVRNLYVFFWSLLFIIPGIVKWYGYSMTTYILQDNDFYEDGLDAIETSVEVMKGNKLKLFMLDLSFIGWYFLSILSFGVLLFYVIPYHKTAVMFFYNDVKEKANIKPLTKQQKKGLINLK